MFGFFKRKAMYKEGGSGRAVCQKRCAERETNPGREVTRGKMFIF
jgi:hypothetical protein